MDPTERLAAYLAGELAAADEAALEEELARDDALRDRLAAMQRADAALGGLRAPEPPPGFEDRLRRAVDAELGQQLGASSAADPVAGAAAPLERLRARRARRWVPALAGAAAVFVLLAGVLVVTGVPRSDEAVFDVAQAPELPGVTAEPAPDVEEEALVEEDALEPEPAAPDDATPEALDASIFGPTLVVGDRDLTEADLTELLRAPALLEVSQLQLDHHEAGELAMSWRAALGAEAPAAELDDAPREDDPAQLRLYADEPLAHRDRLDVDRCLEPVLAEAAPAIPAYVELGRYDGQEVVAVGLVTRDPATGGFTRRELWVVLRETCEPVRHVH